MINSDTQNVSHKVAISADFLTAFSVIPRQKQGKVIQFLSKFRNNPTSSGINLEKIQGASDQSIRSVRIDDEYRGIIHKPQKGDVYLLLWVDSHDRAYQWAGRKRCIVNAGTGSIQIFEVEYEPENSQGAVFNADVTDVTYVAAANRTDGFKAPGDSAAPSLPPLPGLFDSHNDSVLIQLGIPEEALGAVRCIRTLDELDRKKHLLPLDAYEALFFLASGFSAEELVSELYGDAETTSTEIIDTEDYAAALQRAGTKHSFMVIAGEEGEKELHDILAAPLEQWRVFLHPLQRRIVEKDYTGPARVLGGAGTGKTVVAMHRAKWLAQNMGQASAGEGRILFTTFTRNLAEDITNNLQKICSPEVMKRIEVVNLDRWVGNYLNKTDYRYAIVYGKSLDKIWEMALSAAPAGLSYPLTFYQEEWDKVIKAGEIQTKDEYLETPRPGRGIRLERRAREEVWPVFAEFKKQMADNGITDAETAMTDARIHLEKNGGAHRYASVIIDEAQDLSIQAFKLLRRIAGEERQNDMFITGDAHQRIYGNRAVMHQCGINIVGRSSRLKINYRTTEETRSWAYRLLGGLSFDDLDGGDDDVKGYRSLTRGPAPEVKSFKNIEEEFAGIAAYIENLKKQGVEYENLCLVARTKKILDLYKDYLNEKGIRIYRIKPKDAEERGLPGLRIATMHRVKGLEFDYIIMASVNHNIVPYEKAIKKAPGEGSGKERETAERALLYVAATRAKKAVLITCYGRRSPFLEEI